MQPVSTLDQLSTLVDITVKIAAAIVGGWWFLRRSIHRVRLNLEQDVRVFRIQEEGGGGDVIILKVLVKMQNIGEVPFSLNQLSVGAVQFLPLPELAVSRLLGTSTGIIDETVTEEDGSQGWTGLAAGDGKIRVELRPGEFEVVPATLRVVATDVQVAMVISQVTEHQRWYKKRPLCWRVHSLVKLEVEEEATVAKGKPSIRTGTGKPIVIKVPPGGASGGPKK
jgi:hypothetical protein